jgi:heme oxygenase-like protein
MNTAGSTVGSNVPRGSLLHTAEHLHHYCSHHPALAALRRFNAHLASRALDHSELVAFLASMAAFNRHTVGGIPILAGRLSDQLLPLVPKRGHEIGAFVLDAAIDEYGLRESVTHVELARIFAEHLGVSLEEVESREHACPAALELGDALYSWYRDKRVAFGLGAHSASETTSAHEFAAWHEIFLKFSEYGFAADAPEFEYMRAHCVHEPDHMDGARTCVDRYLEVLPGHALLVQDGMRAYLSLYQHMFEQLDARLFSSTGTA